MSGENRRSREAVRNSVRTYGVMVMDPASLPLKKTKETESQESVSRFSEKSLHSHYRTQKEPTKPCFQRIPYATLLACIIGLFGIAVFSVTRRRALVLTKNMFHDVFERDNSIMSDNETFFLVIEILFVTLTVLVLIAGILATGDTRGRVYGAWKARIGGRCCCAVLMAVTIAFLFLWAANFWFWAAVYTTIHVSKFECLFYNGFDRCLYLTMYNSLLSGDENLNLYYCVYNKYKIFCKDFIEKAKPAFFIISVGGFLVIFALILYLICLAANYARIRSQAKLQELEELRNLELDLSSSKDRF